MCLDNSDWLGVAKVSEVERIPSYGDVIQLTTRVSSPENCPSYSRFRVIKVRVIETNLYLEEKNLDQSIPKIYYLILKIEALDSIFTGPTVFSCCRNVTSQQR